MTPRDDAGQMPARNDRELMPIAEHMLGTIGNARDRGMANISRRAVKIVVGGE